MRYFEITSGMRVPTSGEERAILDKVEDAGHIARDTLDEREAEVARRMVSRGLLVRLRVDDKVCFGTNADPNLRRF
jgi:hypothetical protein